MNNKPNEASQSLRNPQLEMMEMETEHRAGYVWCRTAEMMEAKNENLS